ncbi:hypothetical protein ONJ23_28005, partial [Salmonella enterica subsp. enterica serovar Virginia]|nr:hypothetical protein [Salmonella enterica subsp. enterica serovar Virginia]
RGLCGGLNINLFKKLLADMKAWSDKGVQCELAMIGSKGVSFFISHDLSVVEHIADEVMVMYLGRCVEKGTKEQIFNNPRHPYT